MKAEMINTGLKDFFKLLNYNWREDADIIKEICYYTKSRVNNSKDSRDFEMSYGMEQPFALKALAKAFGSKYFFEIGTGRGTGSYAVATTDSLEMASTIDIIPYNHKRPEAIGYDPAMVSNSDLYQMVKSPGKEKINFYERSQYSNVMQHKPEGGYDLFFIDGNHTDFNVILEDFLMCQLLFGENPIIVWDDYYPDKFAIKDVVRSVLNQNRDYKAFLVSTRGHLFGSKTPEENSGMVVMMKEKTYEDLFAKS